MKLSGKKILACLAALLPLGATAVLLVESGTTERPASAEFQRLVGGLGLGAATNLEACGFSFDPRVESDCPYQCEPIPGGYFFCPLHGLSVFPLAVRNHSESPAPSEAKSDASPP